MPTREEWDFRAVAAADCDLACYWEYSRSVGSFTSDPNSWVHRENGYSPFLYFSAGELRVQPWVLLDESELAEIRNCLHRPRAFRVQPLSELVQECLNVMSGVPEDALTVLSQMGANVMWTGFREHGSEKVISEFKTWARGEFQKCSKTRRGKAAAPPFNCLKWLSAYRLERARRAAGVSFANAQKAIVEHQHRFPSDNRNDVLPLYASQGAWSKAVSDAKALLKQHAEDSMALFYRFFDPLWLPEYLKQQNEKRSA